MQKKGHTHQDFIRNHTLRLLLLLARLTRYSAERYDLGISSDFNERDLLILSLKIQLLRLTQVLHNERLVVKNSDSTAIIAMLEKKSDGSVTLWHEPLPLP